MQYSEKELRVADLLALILIGFGLAVVPLGALLGRAYWIPCGLVLVCLGAALEIKIRRIVRNGGHEDQTPEL
jgi:hypothetical protein